MTLRQLIHLHPRRGRWHHGSVAPSVEELQALIERLTVERQQLRIDLATPEELERNRRAITQAQWDLSRALIARYRPHAA